jgi:arylsulfatase A-like enzyme/Flp pilus assembly protein TadD
LAPEGTPVILISVDTLRSDRLPAYGYNKVGTPAIDRLRQDSVLFEHAYATVPLTLPSHATALTGLLPPAHRVRDNMGYRLETNGIPYLPRDLKALGYATGAAVSTFVLRGSSGLAESFDLYDDNLIFTEWTDVGSVQRHGHETLDRSLPWLRSVAEKPFFFFFHIYEPHTPYQAPEPYASRYESAYDAEVALADEIVGRLLDELESLGVYDRALIIFMSDHGEGLGEHGYHEHGPLLYREVIQVPLMLKLPGNERAGDAVAAGAQLADIYPTVLQLLGQPLPAGLAGDSLLELEDRAQRRIYSETAFPRLHFGWSDLASLVEYPYHYIHGPDPELYDLESDPGAVENILRRERRLASSLAGELESLDRTLEAPAAEDAETMQKLAALGYVGSGSTEETEGPLPDPKARLFVLDLMGDALDLSTAGHHEEAVVAFRRVLEEEPGMVDAWEKLGLALAEVGQGDEAIAAFEEAMRLSGGAPQIALSMTDVFLRLDRLEEARIHAEIALDVHELARDVLAQVAIRQGDLERASTLAEEAVANRRSRLAPLITLADLRLKQERFQDSLDVSEEVIREFGDRQDLDKLRGLFFTRGRALVQLGRPGEARAAFEREIEISPDQLAPYTHLAYLHALEGRGAEAGGTLQKMVQINPTARAHAEAVRALEAMGDPRSAAALLNMARGRWPGDPELIELGRELGR